jgi:hypothetical protein
MQIQVALFLMASHSFPGLLYYKIHIFLMIGNNIIKFVFIFVVIIKKWYNNVESYD